MEQFPIEFVSNIASIVLVIILVISYFKHKKRVEVIQQLDSLKSENQLTQEDISYIYENEKEYKEKAEKAEGFAKLLNPIFILIVGVLFVYLPFSDAMIHLNVFVVAFIFIQLDKINKKNTYLLLKELKKDIKKEED